MSEPLILTLDGSTDVCSTALLRSCTEAEHRGPWEVLARRSVADGRAQARVLLQLVDEMLGTVGGGAGDLAAIVAGIGPGTFTGVRITVATARALALALRVPVVGISTLAALASEAAAHAGVAELDPGIVLPLVDARRGQVFYAVYRRARARAGGETRWERFEDYGVCYRGELPGLVRSLGCRQGHGGPSREADPVEEGAGQILVTGDAKVLPARLEDDFSGQWLRPATVGAEWLLRGQERLGEPGLLPAGARLHTYLVGELHRGSEAGDGEAGGPSPGEVGSPESVRPIYVRAPDADIHITKMRDPWAAGR